MAKPNKVVELLKQAIALLTAGGDSAEPKIPSVKAINALEPEELADLASSLGIKSKKPKLLLILASQIVSGEADDATDEELAALCKATGVSEGDDTEETIKALSEFFAGGAEEASGDDSGDDDDEKPVKKAKKVVSEDDDEDEKPAKKKKADADADGDDDEDEKPVKKKVVSDEDDDDADEKPSKKKVADSDDSDDDDAEPPKAAKWLAAHNKVAKKPAKNWAALKELLTDDEGNVAKWGVAYVKGENAWCCGVKCKDVQHDGEEVAKCLVTGKLFKPTDEGELEEVVVDEE